jgi:predicted O-methyltransferase YrrM
MDWDLFVPFEDMKKEGKWPVPWTSAMGLVPEIKKLGDNLIGCEIGSNFGINIVYFLDNLPNIEKIITIDPYIAYDDTITGGEIFTQEDMNKVMQCFLINMEPYRDKIEFIHDTSDNYFSKIADNSLDYIFIDGDHNYEAVIKDMKNYYSKVKDGGIFSGHDVGSQGVQRALNEFVREFNIDVQTIKTCEHQTWYWIKNSKSDEYITITTG